LIAINIYHAEGKVLPISTERATTLEAAI